MSESRLPNIVGIRFIQKTFAVTSGVYSAGKEKSLANFRNQVTIKMDCATILLFSNGSVSVTGAQSIDTIRKSIAFLDSVISRLPNLETNHVLTQNTQGICVDELGFVYSQTPNSIIGGSVNGKGRVCTGYFSDYESCVCEFGNAMYTLRQYTPVNKDSGRVFIETPFNAKHTARLLDTSGTLIGSVRAVPLTGNRLFLNGKTHLYYDFEAECVFWKATTIAKLVFTRARESESTLDSRADSFKVNSVSVSWNLGFELDLETAFLKFETAVYNPSVYPGMKLQYSFDTVRVTIIVFKSGKALGIGFKSVACVHDLLVRVRTDIQQKMQEMDNGARTGNRCRSENTDYSHCI
jgi:TATA-box binding protein (TBP) (component of TFIID and TFIIIB)